MQEKIDNQLLISQCAKNKRDAQEQLYRQYFDGMFSIGKRYSKDEDKIIEWVNNGFLKVFKKIHTVKNPAALSGWIKSVVYRCILDGIRADKRYNQSVYFNLEHEINQTSHQVSTYDYDVLIKHLDYLPEASKNVFELFVIEGFSHKDIAEKCGISEGTSKWHLNNAKTKLRNILIEQKIIAVG